MYHVPLFFFISGCTEAISQKNYTFVECLNKCFKNIGYPFFYFGIANVIFDSINNNLLGGKTWFELMLLFKGSVRNNGIGMGLWFLSCLFIMKLSFWFVKRVDNNILIVLLGCISYVIACKIIFPKANGQPSLFWNIDSMMYYIIFYALGYALFPMINSLILEKRYFIIEITGMISGIYSVSLFFKKDLLEFIDGIYVISIFAPVIRASVIIWFWVTIAFCFSKNKFLTEIGKNTLYLCGSEYMVKYAMISILSIFGLSIQRLTPLCTYFYTFILIVLTNKYIIPLEKENMQWIIEQVSKLKTKVGD